MRGASIDAIILVFLVNLRFLFHFVLNIIVMEKVMELFLKKSLCVRATINQTKRKHWHGIVISLEKIQA